MKRNQRTNRRSYLKTLGIIGTTGLGSTGLVAANGNDQGIEKRGGKKGLDDIAVDVVLNYSIADDSSNEPDSLDHFGYPYPPIRFPNQKGGFYFARTDPATKDQEPNNPSFFDISEIKLTPNGNTLHHSLQFFAGFLISDDSKMKPYPLVHTGDGRFVSRGQVMNLKTRSKNEIQGNDAIPNNFLHLPPFEHLTAQDEELSWRAVCTDRIQLETEDGNPTTTPEWGLTRADFYSRGKGRPEFKVSLLYTIWNPGSTNNSSPPGIPILSGIPSEVFDGSDDGVMFKELIKPGRLNMGGQ